MKKLIALIAFLTVLSAASAQTYVTVGNTLQRAPTGLGWMYRFNMGVPGFMQLYTKQQVDSLINHAGLGYVPYTGAAHDVDLVSTGKGLFAEYSEVGHGVATGSNLYGGYFYNNSPTGFGLKIEGGDATHEALYIGNYTGSGTPTVRIFGDGHAIFNGSISSPSISQGGNQVVDASNIESTLANDGKLPTGAAVTVSLGTKADTANYIKRTVGAIHLASITQLLSYAGTATTVIVTDSLRGGTFNLSATSPYPVDNGIVFSSSGGKYWIRDISNADAINIQWYGAKADWLVSNRTVTRTGTDSRTSFLAAYAAAYKMAKSVYIPGKYPYSFGLSDRIKIGQGTVIKGESGFLPYQSTSPGDSVKFAPLSILFFYNHTDGITTDEAGAFRCQGNTLKDFLVVGKYSGSAADTTAGLKLYSNTHGNPGVNSFIGFHVSDFGICFDLKKANDSQFDKSGAENSRLGWKGGLNSTHISYSEAAFLDTVGIIKGSLNNISNNQFGACKNGMVLDSVFSSTIATNHFYSIIGDALYIRNACSNNIVDGNQFPAPGRYAIRFKSSGANNTVSNNIISTAAYPAIYASNTTKLIIRANSLISPTTSSIIAFKIDTCTNYVLSNNTIGDYAYNKQLDATASTQTNIDNFNNIKRRGTASDTPVDIAYNAGTSNTSPSTLGNAATIRSLNGNAYNGSGETNTIKMVMRTNEANSSSALGSAFDFYGVRNGTTTVTNLATIDGNGISVIGGTNSVALYPGVSSGADILRTYPLRTDKQFLADYFTSGTGVGTATRWFNKSDITNNSSFKISAASDTAFINYQDIGTGTTNPIRNVSLNGSSFGSALSSWNFGNTAVRLSKMGLYQSTNAIYARLQLTSLITNGGQAIDIIPNGTSTQTDIRLYNQSGGTNFGSFKIATDADTARIVAQTGGSPTTPLVALSYLPGGLGTGLSKIQYGNVAVNVRNLTLDVTGFGTGSIPLKSTTGKLTYLGLGPAGYYMRVNTAGTLPEYTNQLTGIITPTTVVQTTTGTSTTDSVMVKIGVTGKMGAVATNLFAKTSDLSNYAPLASPAFTGIPTAPTAATGTNSTQIATTAFVKAQGYGTGNGTVTSIGTSYGLTGGPITTTGTIVADSTLTFNKVASTTQYINATPIFKSQTVSIVGTLNLRPSSTVITNTGYATFQVNSDGKTFMMAPSSASGSSPAFFQSNNTSTRTYITPDKDGTMALLSDISAATDNILSKTANYTIISGDFATGKKSTLDLYVDATAGNVTITLPSSTTFAGYTIYVTKTDASANTVTVNTVSGANTLTVQYQSRQFNTAPSIGWVNH